VVIVEGVESVEVEVKVIALPSLVGKSVFTFDTVELLHAEMGAGPGI
jgi:hypothetical protein